MIWEIQINSGVSELNGRYDVSSNVTMFCNDTTLKVLSGFKIAKVVEKYYGQQVEKISILQAWEVLVGTV